MFLNDVDSHLVHISLGILQQSIMGSLFLYIVNDQYSLINIIV